MINFFTSFTLIFFLASQAFANTALPSDTTVRVPASPTVQLTNNETPLILRKGEPLVIKIEATQQHKTTVRVHSSLGKLVKEFMEVENQINMLTDKLLPGIYLVVIKQADKREVRKFLITE